MNCEICGMPNADRHHIKTRASGGSNEDFNIIHLCRKHHSECHQIGRWSFAKKYDITERFATAIGKNSY
jgi:hypothetical protein